MCDRGSTVRAQWERNFFGYLCGIFLTGRNFASGEEGGEDMVESNSQTEHPFHLKIESRDRSLIFFRKEPDNKTEVGRSARQLVVDYYVTRLDVLLVDVKKSIASWGICSKTLK